MVALAPIKALKEKQKQLKEAQEKLLEELKTKHTKFYNWMKTKKIDPTDLKMYSASLAAAMVVALASATSNFEDQKLEAPVVIIDREELNGLDQDEKAKLVWERYGHIITRVADKYDLDPKLIFATIMLESGGNTYAVRHEPHINDASYGLGQILYGTALGLGFEGNPQDLYDPEVNIELVGRYHARNKSVYGPLTNEQLTIAYNSGNPYGYPLPGHMDKFANWYERVANYGG